MINNSQFWNVLAKIDESSRSKINTRTRRVAYGSERAHIIRSEIPYNPVEIMREASRLAATVNVPDSENWYLNCEGAGIGSQYTTPNFFTSRLTNDSDGDKLCALEVLAQVCEYVRKRKE